MPLQLGLGQGMSIAAQEALLLRRLLRRGGDTLAGLAPGFFAEAGELMKRRGRRPRSRISPYRRPQGQRPPDLERRLKFGEEPPVRFRCAFLTERCLRFSGRMGAARTFTLNDVESHVATITALVRPMAQLPRILENEGTAAGTTSR